MAADYASVSKRRVEEARAEVFHDATFDKERAQDLFNSGVLTLPDRAITEQIYLSTIAAVARMPRRSRRVFGHHEDVEGDRWSIGISATSRFSIPAG